MDYFINDKYFELKVHPDLQINKTCTCDCPVRIEQGEDKYHGEFKLSCIDCNQQAYLLSQTKSLEQSESLTEDTHQKK